MSAPSPPISVPVHALEKPPPQGGASRQACHAGGHAGRATQSRAVRESQRHPARAAARSTSTRRPLISISVFSVFSVLLARRFFSAREDFLCRHTCLVAALPRCGFSFSGPLTPDIFPARGDFHAATRASCRPDPNRHRRLVAALSRRVLFSPCPLCPLWFSFSVFSVVFPSPDY